jgi:hypothetical protein
MIRHPYTSHPLPHLNDTWTLFRTTHSDHDAVLLSLPAIGDTGSETNTPAHTSNTTRSHPPFVLPIPPNLIEQYTTGTPLTHIATTTTYNILQQLQSKPHITTSDIDTFADALINTLHTYHEEAINIWPMKEPSLVTEPRNKLHSPVSRAGLRQVTRLVQLRNETNNLGAYTNSNTPITPQKRTELEHKAMRLLNTDTAVPLDSIPKSCSKAIGHIIREANTKLESKLRTIEDLGYDKSPRFYHHGLKVSAGIKPRAKDTPKLTSIRDPLSGKVTRDPAEIIKIATAHLEAELERATPPTLPEPPWTIPTNPDNFSLDTNHKPNSSPLEHTITRSH